MRAGGGTIRKGFLMVRAVIVLLSVVSTTPPRTDTDHLVPIDGSLKRYDVLLRRGFVAAFRNEVILNAMILKSFEKECAVGLRPGKTRGSFLAFALEPSASLWDSLTWRRDPAGKVFVLREGKYVPLAANPPLRGITVKSRARPISPDLAGRIMVLWIAALKSTRPLKDADFPGPFGKPVGVLDGTSYRFSAVVPGEGKWSGETQDEEEPKMRRLSQLAERFAQYANGKADLPALPHRRRTDGSGVSAMSTLRGIRRGFRTLEPPRKRAAERMGGVETGNRVGVGNGHDMRAGRTVGEALPGVGIQTAEHLIGHAHRARRPLH